MQIDPGLQGLESPLTVCEADDGHLMGGSTMRDRLSTIRLVVSQWAATVAAGLRDFRLSQ
jgi:hypothetical protein